MSSLRVVLAVLLVAPALLLASSRAGSALRAAPQSPPATTDADDELMAALFDQGAEIYGINCLECHMEGGVGRKLDGDAALANAETVITQLLEGSPNFTMPAFASTLSDREIAAVATYVRNAGENHYGIVREADVRRLRDRLAPAH